MDSYNEIRRVRQEMSASVGHDIRALIMSINSRWPEDAGRTIDPGTKAEQSDADEGLDRPFLTCVESTPRPR